MKTIWKATVCIVAVLLSFSIYSCGDDDDETVGSRDLLLGTGMECIIFHKNGKMGKGK